MVKVSEELATTSERVVPWWERSETYRQLWHGSLFDRMILHGDDPEEQRIQKIDSVPGG